MCHNRVAVTALLSVISLTFPICAQHRVDSRQTYERLLLIVPMTGTGTAKDPMRPLYTPAPGDTASHTGIIAFNYVMSDDGKSALVELVAADRSTFDSILAEKRTDTKIFEKGKTATSAIAGEFKKLRKDFDFDAFEVRVR